MKFINKLLIGSAAAISLPLIVLTSCNQSAGIGAPDVSCDQTEKTATLGYGQSVKFNFTLSNELSSGMTLDKVSFKRSEQEQGLDAWIFIENVRPTIVDKKFTVRFYACKTYGEQKPTTATGKVIFTFKNSSGEENKIIEGFTFNFKE